MKTRLFIGNLAPAVTESELRDKFEALLSNHKNEAQLGNVEVRCKNEDNYFGYVDIHLNSQEVRDNGPNGNSHQQIPGFVRKYIDLMNNTKWKGSLIKVQVAKESFIDKLKKEQANNKFNSRNNFSNKQEEEPLTDAKPAKFTQSSIEVKRNQQQANEVLYKINKSQQRRDWKNKRAVSDQNNTQEQSGSPKKADYGFEIVSASQTLTKKSTSPKKKKKSKAASSSSSDDSDDEVRGGIPKFKGLLVSYPEGFQPEVVEPKESDSNSDKDDTDIQKKLSIVTENEQGPKPPSIDNVQPKNSIPSTGTGINFKKNKQQKSDLLRLQSLDKMKDLKTQQKNLIKSSLSSVSVSAPPSEYKKVISDNEGNEQGEPEEKRQKMTLFDQSDTDDEEGEAFLENNKDAFQVKKQFEGKEGQRLLELKTRWGNDDRFKIDDRFKEDDSGEVEDSVQIEKEKQYSVLTDILGKVVGPASQIRGDTEAVHGKKSKTTAAGSSNKDTFSSVILPRYDPEAETEIADDKEQGTKENEKKVSKSKKGSKAETETQETEKPIRSNEPSTFKTVSNLKTLFSSSGGGSNSADATNQDSQGTAKRDGKDSSFSLLAAFGQAESSDESDGDDGQVPGRKTKSSTETNSSGPRSFWQSNPFKYDSSDDEDENVKVKVTKKSATTKEAPSTILVHGQVPFFFTETDSRFEGLHDYFLKDDQPEVTGDNKASGPGEVAKTDSGSGTVSAGEAKVDDFSLKRQELKSIVKAKIKNAKRKDEKRSLAIKRSIRKRNNKRRHLQKTNNGVFPSRNFIKK